MTPDEASARAREAVWGEIVAVDPAASLRRTPVEEQPIDTAIDALIRLERARGGIDGINHLADLEGWTEQERVECDAYDRFNAELTAAIKALAADTPRSGTEA
ncbi:MAG: hypothetical protein NUW01_00065 [Gemmatimonadaceae bacterium]|nr:hypothetical protein [Gemmatimonadaceae bacterium]